MKRAYFQIIRMSEGRILERVGPKAWSQRDLLHAVETAAYDVVRSNAMLDREAGHAFMKCARNLARGVDVAAVYAKATPEAPQHGASSERFFGSELVVAFERR